MRTQIFAAMVIVVGSSMAVATNGPAPQCAALFVSAEAAAGQRYAERFQRAAIGKQTVTRDLSQTKELMPRLSARLDIGRRTPGFHWIDVGGGSGAAAIESFAFKDQSEKYKLYEAAGVYGSGSLALSAAEARSQAEHTPIFGQHHVTVVSVENILEAMNDPLRSAELLQTTLPSARETYRLKFEYAFAKKLEQAHVFRYLHGRKIEEIPDEELGKADLITDALGAFTYSIDKIEILETYSRLLKPGGLAIIRTVQPLIHVHLNGKTALMDLNDLMKIHPVPGLKFEDGCLLLEKLPGTTAALSSLAAKMSFLKLTDLQETPPTYHYEYTP